MAGVTADSVIVAIEARTKAYETAMEAAAKKTEDVFARIRKANTPVTVGSGSVTGQVDREASAVERATARKVTAKRKEVETEAQATARISAMVDRSIANRERDAQSAERTSKRIAATQSSAGLAARQTAIMRTGTALGSAGTMAAPTAAVDKINYLLRDQIDLQTKLAGATASGNKIEAQGYRDQLTQLRLINQYKRAGLDETQADIRAEERLADIQRRRSNARTQQIIAAGQASSAPSTASGGSAIGGAIRGARNLALGAVAGYGAIQGAREYLELTDAYKQYNAQLRLATAENGNLAQAQTDTQRIANETRTGLAETAQLYATFQRNAGQLGLTQEQSARATETVTKSFQISGATAAEASGGLRQFLQALQSGTLRGEEFNSVVENAPRLAKLLADQLTGGNIGALRALSQAGKITGDDLKAALTNQKFTSQIDEEFKQLPVTFDQAMTVLKNAATVTFGEFDQGGQFSTSLANFLTQGSDGFAGLGQDARAAGEEIRAAFSGLENAFSPLLSGAEAAFGGIRQQANYTRDSISQILGLIDEIRNRPANRIRETFGDTVSNFAGVPQRGGVSNFNGRFLAGFKVSTAQSKLTDAIARLESLGYKVPRPDANGNINMSQVVPPAPRRSATYQPQGATRIDANLQKYQEQIADLEKLKANASGKELATINKQIARRQRIVANLQQGVGLAAATAAAGGAGGGGRKGPSQASLEAKAQRRDDVFEAESQSLNSAIISAKGKQAQTIEQTAEAAIANANAEFAEREIKYTNLEQEKKIGDGKGKLLISLAAQLRAQSILTANTEKAAALANQGLQVQIDQNNNKADLLRSEASVTKSRIQRQAKEQEAFNAEYDARYEALALAYQKATPGSDESFNLEGQIKDFGEIRANAQKKLLQDNETPYQKYRNNLDDAGSLSDEIDNIKIEVLDEVADSLARATTNALGLTGALGDIVGQIIKIGIQRKLIGPLADGLFGKADGSTSGGLGGIISSFAGLFGGARASGGDVSAGKLYKINENGIEGFQPAQSGKIIPLGRMTPGNGGGVAVTQYISVDGRNSVTPAGFASDILRQANAHANKAAARAGKSAYEASPQRSQKLSQLGS